VRLGIVGRFHQWYIRETVVITVRCLDRDTIATVLAVPELFVDSGVVLNYRLIEVLARLMSVGELLVGWGRNENLLKQERAGLVGLLLDNSKLLLHPARHPHSGRRKEELPMRSTPVDMTPLSRRTMLSLGTTGRGLIRADAIVPCRAKCRLELPRGGQQHRFR
jgi:hypothetical protein